MATLEMMLAKNSVGFDEPADQSPSLEDPVPNIALLDDGKQSAQVSPVDTAGAKASHRGKHRHTRTWAGPAANTEHEGKGKRSKVMGHESKRGEGKDAQTVGTGRKSLDTTVVSPYLSEEERSLFVKSPQLLNEATFEPRVIKGASPYVPRSRKSGKNSRSHSSDDDKELTGSPPKIAPIQEQPEDNPSPETGSKSTNKSPSKIYSGVHRRYNSMQTLHLASVLHSPDVQEILQWCEIILTFSRALYGNIKLSEKVDHPVFLEIYSEMVHPLNEGSRRKMPAVDEIVDFVTRIYTGIALAPENCVMALAYIERLVALTNVTLHPSNWRRITLAALLLASKVWEDLAVHNRDMLRVFPQLKLRDVLELEHAFLEHLQFTVALRASVYAKYYFELRTLSTLDENSFPLRPLSVEGAMLMEARSRGVERKVADELRKRGSMRRSKSLNSLTSSSHANKDKTVGYDAFIKITHQRAPTHGHDQGPAKMKTPSEKKAKK